MADDNRKFIDKAASYALGLTDVRAVMVDELNLFEITDKQLEHIKARNYEIEYKNLEKEKTPQKQPIEVFLIDDEYYIDMSAAYHLNLVSVETFNNMNGQLYKISDNLLAFLNNKYNVELIPEQKKK